MKRILSFFIIVSCCHGQTRKPATRQVSYGTNSPNVVNVEGTVNIIYGCAVYPPGNQFFQNSSGLLTSITSSSIVVTSNFLHSTAGSENLQFSGYAQRVRCD